MENITNWKILKKKEKKKYARQILQALIAEILFHRILHHPSLPFLVFLFFFIGK